MRPKYIESIPYEGLNNATHLDVKVYYDKGGRNWFSGADEPRGFYISVTPVTRSGGMVSTALFSGAKKLLLEVSRYTDKQHDRAIELSHGARDELIRYVLEKNKRAA